MKVKMNDTEKDEGIKRLKGVNNRLKLQNKQLKAAICGGSFIVGQEYEFSEDGIEWFKDELHGFDLSITYDAVEASEEAYYYIRRIQS